MALVTVSVLVVVLLAGGGAPQPVPRAARLRPGHRLGLPSVRLLTDLAGLATVGLLLAAGLLLSSPELDTGRSPGPRGRVGRAGGHGVAAGRRGRGRADRPDIFGISPAQATDATVLRSFLGQTSQGRALLVQVALLIVVAGLARAAASPRGAVLALVVALVR